MKTTSKLFCALIILFLVSCGGKEKEKEKESFTYEKTETTADKNVSMEEENIPASKTIDLNNKGVGPIKEIKLDSEINQELVTQGEDIFKKMCTACHRENKKFIGPAPHGVLERRSPEWVMNMILNPEGMVQNDPLAKALLIEFNGSPMANQNLTEEEARAILEYFRTLK
ncbi:cytochrome c [Gaetbulibacter sp. M240]|uniref:c-type cytochrome n=1 Tax=Gaetbulibacter sp. M240 TaxID=3126511 RepID=UPI00374F2BBE